MNLEVVDDLLKIYGNINVKLMVIFLRHLS